MEFAPIGYATDKDFDEEYGIIFYDFGVDSVVFGVIAFAGLIPASALVCVVLSCYLVKIAFEALATPLTYLILNKLKKAERIDVYDRGINYNPFHLSECK